MKNLSIQAQNHNVLRHVASLVEPGSSVLDVGCGDGHLLDLLTRERQVKARGLEISRTGVSMCVARGLSVVQGDADTDLIDYPDGSFDYIILTQTIQAMRRPLNVLQQAMRIGRRVIVSTPNFAHWRLRLSLSLGGRMPQSASLPTAWYQTDNIHLCTISDFISLCRQEEFRVEKSYAGRQGAIPKLFYPAGFSLWLANLRDEEAVFLLSPKV